MDKILMERVERALNSGGTGPAVEAAKDRLSSALTDVGVERLAARCEEALHTTPDGTVYADTRFLNQSRGLLPGFTLKSMGFGEFYLAGPGGAEIQFDRMRGKPFPDQNGRSHKVYDNRGGELVRQLVAAAREAGLAEGLFRDTWDSPDKRAFGKALDRYKAAKLGRTHGRSSGPGDRRSKEFDDGDANKAPGAKGGVPGRKGSLPASHSREEKGKATGARRSKELGRDKGSASGKKPAAARGGGKRKPMMRNARTGAIIAHENKLEEGRWVRGRLAAISQALEDIIGGLDYRLHGSGSSDTLTGEQFLNQQERRVAAQAMRQLEEMQRALKTTGRMLEPLDLKFGH